MQVTHSFIGFAAAGLLLVAQGGAHAHPGGLNAEGCHNNRKTGDYHCHRGSTEAAPSRGVDSARNARPMQRQQQAGGPTCYTGPRGGTYTITKSGRKNYSGC